MVPIPEMLVAGTLRLRPMRRDDLAAIIEQLEVPDTAQWLAAVPAPYGEADAAALLAFAEEPLHCVRVLESEGAVIGGLALRPSVWFWLAADARGCGQMREALKAAIAAVFAQPAPPLKATARGDNSASLTLLRSLGFSTSPSVRRMHFCSTGRSHDCVDHVMTSEQWHFLYPANLPLASFALRPAGQEDLSAVAMLLQCNDTAWVQHASDLLEVSRFVERHRCRLPETGLFVIEGIHRNCCGLILLEAGRPVSEPCFDTEENRVRFLDAWAAERPLRPAFGRGPEISAD